MNTSDAACARFSGVAEVFALQTRGYLGGAGGFGGFRLVESHDSLRPRLSMAQCLERSLTPPAQLSPMPPLP